MGDPLTLDSAEESAKWWAWVEHPREWRERACEDAKLRSVKFLGDQTGGAL